MTNNRDDQSDYNLVDFPPKLTLRLTHVRLAARKYGAHFIFMKSKNNLKFILAAFQMEPIVIAQRPAHNKP